MTITNFNAKRVHLSDLEALIKAPEVFWGSDLTEIPVERRGGVIGGWVGNKMIVPTGETREVWVQVSEDVMKKKKVKQWRKIIPDRQLHRVFNALSDLMLTLDA